MNVATLRIGMQVQHPNYGAGVVKALTEQSVEVKFDDGILRTMSPQSCPLRPAEAFADVHGLEMPLEQLIAQVTRQTLEAVGYQAPDGVVEGLASRWCRGTLILKPSDPTLQPKEIELEVFFHKIVMMRNNLRVLEQRINGSETLSSADKVEWQQYISRCYGSMTTFNLLFKDKGDGFSGKPS